MSEDPSHPWGTGATRYTWTDEVQAVVRKLQHRFPRVSCNTYVCHPWCGWSALSVDVWDREGRGHALPDDLGYEVREFLMGLPGKPLIRHTIFKHQLWTRWGGYSYWRAPDHSGRLRHVHVTYMP